MLAQKLAKVPLPTREEEATAWDLQEQKWAAQEEEDNANKAELELELNERQSFITRMTEAGQTSVQVITHTAWSLRQPLNPKP